MSELDVGSFEVEIGLLILAHAINFLIRADGLKAHGQVVVASKDRFQLASLNVEGTALGICKVESVTSILLKQSLSFVIVDYELSSPRHRRSDLAVRDFAFGFLGDFDARVGRFRFLKKGPVLLRHLGDLRGSHPQSVRAPWLNPELMVVEREDELVAILDKHSYEGWSKR